MLPGGQLFIRNVYVLRREGEDTPLVEELRAQDLNGDGDQRDSNNLFGVGLEDDDYTPLWRMVMVTIPADTPSIEAEGGQPEVTDAAQLFDVAPDYTITPIEGAVLDYELTETLINCPLQSANGTL